MDLSNPLVTPDKTLDLYSKFLNEDGNHNFTAFIHTMNHVFSGIDFKNKRVLEVGSGRGLMTVYAALNGAKKVVSLEPELEGSYSDAFDIQKSRISKLGLNNVEMLRQDFNTWNYNAKSFDIILSFASINHLYESTYHALQNVKTFQRYVRIASNMKRLLNEQGVAVITDACRYGLFFFLKEIGINRPWAINKKTNVNYRYHQNPHVWKKVFIKGGFSNVKIKYPLPYKLRHFKSLVDNPLSNFFLKAGFILHCRV